jgi:hypothetical protein
MIVPDDKLRRMWKGVEVSYLCPIQVIETAFACALRKVKRNYRRESRCLYRESSPGPPACEIGVLTTELCLWLFLHLSFRLIVVDNFTDCSQI